MKNILTIFIFIEILLCLSTANAQNRYFEWMNTQTHTRDRIYLDSRTYLREEQAGKWKNIGAFTLDSNVLYDLPYKFASKFFYPKVPDNVLFTVAGTGKVYQFDQGKKLLSRIDKTYFKGYNFSAPQFVRNDTLYNFGGHGFWTYSKVLTYYDHEIQEWQNIRSENFGPDSFIEGYQGYAKQNDIFYSGGAEIEAGLKNFNRVINDNLFAFDFKTLRWTLLGKINPLLPFKSVRNVYWDGAHFIHLAPDKMFIIDPIKNEILVIVNPKYFLLKNFYTVGDSIYSYWENQTTQIKLSKKALLKEAKYVGKFYENESYTLYGYLLGGLSLLGLAALGYNRYRKRNKYLDTIIKKGDHFSKLEYLLLKKLIEVEDKHVNFISVLQINEILGIEAKSPDNQRRIRTKFLNDLNLKLLLNFQIPEAIERFQFDEDKRLTIYRLKREVKPAIITLL